MQRPVSLAVTLVASLVTGPAIAHVGPGAHGGVASGFLHPLVGWDHVAAMVAVGLWGACLGRPAIYVLPVAFPLAMVFGGFLGVTGAPVPGVEAGIAASALLLGLAVTIALRPPLRAAAAMVAVLAVFHGHAHGVEMPEAASPFGYALGFVAATSLLHLAGISVGLLARSPIGARTVQAVGAVIAVAGLGFLTGAI
jgi:urease accessory protein